jgi:hypothetical protein
MAYLPPPTAGRRPFRGNALVSHIMGDSPPARFNQIHRGGGDLHNNSPGRFEGVVAATTWGNRHFLYRRPRPEGARSGATRLLPTSWATPHPLCSIKFVEGGEIYISIHQGDLRGFSLPQHGATDIASTAAHGRKTHVLGKRACFPHHRRLPTRSVGSIDRGGGDPFNNLLWS